MTSDLPLKIEVSETWPDGIPYIFGVIRAIPKSGVIYIAEFKLLHLDGINTETADLFNSKNIIFKLPTELKWRRIINLEQIEILIKKMKSFKELLTHNIKFIHFKKLNTVFTLLIAFLPTVI
jgi:hypothetical protein